MEVKTTQFSEVLVNRDELEAVIAAYVQAQLGGQTAVISEIKFNVTNEDVESALVKITISFPKSASEGKPIFIKQP